MSRDTKRRLNLWREDPRCRRCGIVTLLPEEAAYEAGVLFDGNLMRHLKRARRKDIRDRIATLEHTRSRYHPARLEKEPYGTRTTLFCWRCNFESNEKELKAIPVEEKRILASGSYKARRLKLLRRKFPVDPESPVQPVDAIPGFSLGEVIGYAREAA